jgi:MerR family transcriptional regulator, light-induced transcriptional regulator
VPEHSGRADNSTEGTNRPTATKLSRGYLETLRAADAAGAYRVASKALAEGMSLAALYQDVIAPAMHEIGRLWERGAITVADEHLATALTHRVLGALKPPAFVDQIIERDPPKPRAMLAAVEGEQHALGLRMAADLLDEAGCQTLYLGADVPTVALMQAIGTLSPDLLVLSATMPELGAVLEGTVKDVRRESPELSVLVGGRAGASPRIGEATPVDDLRLLERQAEQLLASHRPWI